MSLVVELLLMYNGQWCSIVASDDLQRLQHARYELTVRTQRATIGSGRLLLGSAWACGRARAIQSIRRCRQDAETARQAFTDSKAGPGIWYV